VTVSFPMRSNLVLSLALVAATSTAWLSGCGSSDSKHSEFTTGTSGGASGAASGGVTGTTSGVNFSGTSGSGSPLSGQSDDGGLAGDSTVSSGVLSAVHIVPADSTLTVQAGQAASLGFTVMGIVDNAPTETDVTSRFVFYVPDNYLVGGFPLDGSPTFTTRLPMTTTDPPQRGGLLTVQATAANPNNATLQATTSLTVQLIAQGMFVANDMLDAGPPNPPPVDSGTTTRADAGDAGDAGDAAIADSGASGGGGFDAETETPIPQEAGSLFGGPADPTRAPTIAYPNNGVMLPPNLKLLDIHWMPGTGNTLFQITFSSPTADITYISRCGSIGGLLAAGGCGFQLDQTGYNYLSASNAGSGNVTVTIQGTDDYGTGVGTSAPIQIQFAQETVNGGVYYWDVTNTRIMRFDFGGTVTTPEVFLAPGQYGTNGGTCIGCHALSADGTKMAASAGGQNDGYLVYIDGVAAPTTPLTANENRANPIQFASFDPLGDLFVAVYGDSSGGPDAGPDNLYFHDGNTGLIDTNLTKPLAFEPDHPAWSPDGTMIAMTHVGHHGTSQQEFLGGIDVATFAAGSVVDGGVTVSAAGGTLGDPVVVVPSSVTTTSQATNSYNPSFAPDSTFLVFSQTICLKSQATSSVCDSDITSNVSATTWAVQPTAGATPIHLDNAAAPGVADGTNATVLDTFPRSTPFETAQGSGKLFWFTVASLRQPGLRFKGYKATDEGTGQLQQQLWMFAVDPAKILAGEDGSYPAFFLPFQDPTTSNHIAQWTQKIVSSTPAPPPPTPPPPPPPPAPPPPTPPK
jgi:hypothetical protein